MWLSQRFYYTVNSRSKIIHLKSNAYSLEMQLVFLNAQKSWLWIWFLRSKKCNLNQSWQPGFIWFWKKVNNYFCFQHSTAKVWQLKHRRRPNPRAPAQTSPKTSYFIPPQTHQPHQPPHKSAFAHGWRFWAAVTIWRDQVKGLWSAVRLHVLPQAPARSQPAAMPWKIFHLVLLNTTCSSGHPLPKRR